jgi:hypothetical protein
MRSFVFVCALLSATSQVVASDKLFCVAEQSVGYKFESGKWVFSLFALDTSKYIVQPSKGKNDSVTEYNYTVTRIGSNDPSHHCYRKDNEIQISCGGLGIGIIINFEKLRFQEIYGFGFVQGFDNGEHTPYLKIGRCTKIDG